MKAITKLSQLDVTKKYTYADYITWQFKERVELIRGWIMEMSPAPSVTHQMISFRLSTILGIFFEKHKCNSGTTRFVCGL
jgi:hypothetical protein